MPKLKKFLSLLFIPVLLLGILAPLPVKAVITDCDAQVTPNQVDSGSTTDFSITITNGSVDRIHWIKFTRPSSNFTLGSIDAIGWSVISDSTSFTISGGSINTGVSRSFTLTSVVAANLNAPSANWTVTASDDAAAGTNPYDCTGTLGTQIGTPDVTPPVISNIQVTSLTYNSATVSWTTDELSDSRVDYGLTGSYGSSVTNATLTTSHSLALSNLSQSTGYHYQVTSVDASNNSSSSSDNTFLTTAKPTSNTGSNNTTTTTKSSGDTTTPVVIITTNLKDFFKQTPEIDGTATDNIAISTIEFSIDNGTNWLPVDSSTGLNSTKADFKFKPANLPDGNFPILVRATDSSGNTGLSETQTLVIDRVLPVIGPAVVSIGPQIVYPAGQLFTAVKNVDQKITISAIGGPISLDIEATLAGESKPKIFTLTRSTSSDLWSGILAFNQEGSYSLLAKTIDGAGNKTQRDLGKALVNKTSKVVSKANNQPIKSAKVSLYYFDPEVGGWVIWDASSFGEQNPQTTNALGEFNFYIPSGKYYLKAASPGFNDFTSKIFVLKDSTNLSVNLEMEKAITFKLGSWNISLPDLSFASGQMVFKEKPSQLTPDPLKNKDLPDFNLKSTTGADFNPVNLLGKDTLITFLTTWNPSSEEQIGQYGDLIDDTNFNIIRIMVLESAGKVRAYQKVAAYPGTFLTDPLGSTLSNFNPRTLPDNIFVSRSGKIKTVINGVLTTSQLRYNLEN